MPEPVTVAAHTLGCKVNRYDTERLLAALTARGCKVTEDSADVYIVNTCTVTHTGESKSLQILRRVRKANPSAVIAACGCLVVSNAEAVRDTGADILFDARNPQELLSRLNLPPGAETLPVSKHRTRAYIKIQDGCDRFCSYCIVPHVRGPLTSRPPDEILDEARALIAQGVREIVLTGIQTAAYGNDKAGFPDVITAVAALPGLARLRLGSIEPYAVSGEFLQAFALSAVCPHIHLSLQSGCDRTLQAMNRRYTAGQYADIVSEIKKHKPDAAVTTDMMVGFPGETDADFAESADFAEAIGFSRMHVFVYSPRSGTPAAARAEQIPPDVKNRRGQKMRALADKLENNYLSAKLGTTARVLFEAEHGGMWEGHTDDYITVRARSGRDLSNEMAEVKLNEVKKGIMYGGGML